MAEEITKTIENVDKLFSEIIVNGESHKSQRYVAPRSQSTSPSSVQSTQGEDVHAVELNDILHNFSDPDITLDVQNLQTELASEISTRSTNEQALSSALEAETTVRQNADTTLQGNINTVSGNVSTLQGNVSTLQGKVTDIEGKIPSQASAQNQLADKNFVNSSISTNTANFLGTYTSMAQIEAIQNPTNNDYVFLQTTDSAGNNVFDRYKYNADQDEWLFEYELNNSSFTAEQWATINSGLTQSSVTQEIEDAINALDVAQVGGATKYIESISQVNGKIVATEKTFAVALLDIAHPVGSLYWTSSSENPAVTFGGGTWKQIKDVFVWAKGDSDTVNATGGDKAVTLTTAQIPSHTHSVTASGTISVTTNPTFTGSEHSHTYTPAGSVSVTTNPTFTGTDTTSGVNSRGHTHNMEHKHGISSSGSHSHNIDLYATRDSNGKGTTKMADTSSSVALYGNWAVANTRSWSAQTNGLASNGAYVLAMSGSDGNHTHTTSSMTNSSGTAITSTGGESQNHTHTVKATGTISGGAYKFTGTQATLKATADGTISGGAYTFTGSAVTSGSEGGGESHNNMPPYVVKYCWERTA